MKSRHETCKGVETTVSSLKLYDDGLKVSHSTSLSVDTQSRIPNPNGLFYILRVNLNLKSVWCLSKITFIQDTL